MRAQALAFGLLNVLFVAALDSFDMDVKEAPKAMPPARRANGAGNAGSVKRRRRRKMGATASVETKSAAATLRKKPWRRKE